MEFETKYNQIKILVEDDLNILESELNILFSGENPLDKKLLSFLTAPSKRLRPLLGFLFLRNVFGEINQAQRDILLAVELIHNATLIHDDVIDESSKRRNQKTINAQFDSNLAVVAGDYLLSVALEKIMSAKSFEVFELFSSALKSLCLGEINQYFNKFNVPSIEDYIEKSEQKTAILFKAGVLGGLILSQQPYDENLKQVASDFSQNFGIAFQIRDDLINILKADDLKPCQNDLSSGVYTAPVIFAHEENPQILEFENIISKINSSRAIVKTKALMDNYFYKSNLALNMNEDNKYKQALLKLTEILKEDL